MLLLIYVGKQASTLHQTLELQVAERQYIMQSTYVCTYNCSP